MSWAAHGVGVGIAGFNVAVAVACGKGVAVAVGRGGTVVDVGDGGTDVCVGATVGVAIDAVGCGAFVGVGALAQPSNMLLKTMARKK